MKVDRIGYYLILGSVIKENIDPLIKLWTISFMISSKTASRRHT